MKQLLDIPDIHHRKLVDIAFEMAYEIHTHEFFKDKSWDEVAEWLQGQYQNMGYDVKSCGASYSYLKGRVSPND
jgi:hypothetical protein